MNHRQPHYLFADSELSELINTQKNSIQAKVNQVPKEQFLATPDSDLLQYFIATNVIEPLSIYENLIRQSEPEECNIDVSNDPYRYLHPFNKSHFYVPGFRFTVELPFSGKSFLWKATPSSYFSVFPEGIIIPQNSDELGKIIMDFSVTHDADFAMVRQTIGGNIDLIKQYIEMSTKQVNQYNSMLPSLVNSAITFRKQKLERGNALTKLLNIPIKTDPNSPSFEPIAIRDKIIKPLPPAPKSNYSPEPGIPETIYHDILKLIKHTGTSFEKTPKTYARHHEEELRDIILSHLNATYSGAAKGEVFNKSGKTDILISQDGKNAFIAECKIWHGSKAFSDSITQLLNYLTWRDCKTALILFNKSNKNFSKILAEIPTTFRNHLNFIYLDKQIDENEWQITFRAIDDEGRHIKTQIMAFNLFLIATGES